MILEAVDVSVRFGGVRALIDVSTVFDAGSVTGLMGPNGAGKTTLFDVLSGLRRPTSGRVLLAGHDITRRSATWRARRGIRRTFQRQQMFGWLSVEDNVLAALDHRGGGGGLLADLVALPTRARVEAERRGHVEAVLDLCGLLDVRAEPAGTIPIGRARMVEFARAIAPRPDVVLLDEPTSGLEAAEAATLGVGIDRLREEGCCVVLVEHDVAFLYRHCDRVVVLDLGRVIADGPPDEVRADRRVRQAYLG